MIFVTVGSDVPFSRLITQVDLWAKNNPDEPVFAQVGRLAAEDYVPQYMQWTDMLPADQFDRHCAEARLIVAHAGMGSIISALATGKPIVILPRSAQLRETRSDHQFATAERFASRPGVYVAWTETLLSDVIDQAMNSTANGGDHILPEYAPGEFTERLRGFILHPRGTI